MMKQVKLLCHRNTSLDSKSVLLSITGTSPLVLRRGDIDAVAQGELDTTGVVVFLFSPDFVDASPKMAHEFFYVEKRLDHLLLFGQE